jgi:hypothetical protein
VPQLEAVVQLLNVGEVNEAIIHQTRLMVSYSVCHCRGRLLRWSFVNNLLLSSTPVDYSG